MADDEVSADFEKLLLAVELQTDISQGASPRELILEACRRNNTSLLEETLADLTSSSKKAGKKPVEFVAEMLNKSYDGVGNGCLHIAATYGSCKWCGESLTVGCDLG
jgi:hypothetical protein